MSYESVKEELERKGYADRITIHPNPCDTVENAARMIGCEEKLIAKTMSCALGLNKGVVAYLDESLKRFEVVYSAAGAPECTAAFRVDELDKVIDAEWIDVCKLIEA